MSWYSVFGSLDAVPANFTMGASIAADMTTVTITIADGSGNTDSETYDTTTDPRVRIIGDGPDGMSIRLEGDLTDLGLLLTQNAPAEGEGEPLENLDDAELLASAGSIGDVDAVFAQLG